MSTHTENKTLRESAALTGAAGTTYSSALRVEKYEELTLFLYQTAQGGWTDEYLDVSVQTKDPDGNWHDLAGATFTQIGNNTAAVPYGEDIGIIVFGAYIRLKYVTQGTTPDFTFQITGIGKGNF